eukprot:scaffold4440_cov109-Isochrysis_galbana.AAC.6
MAAAVPGRATGPSGARAARRPGQVRRPQRRRRAAGSSLAGRGRAYRARAMTGAREQPARPRWTAARRARSSRYRHVARPTWRSRRRRGGPRERRTWHRRGVRPRSSSPSQTAPGARPLERCQRRTRRPSRARARASPRIGQSPPWERRAAPGCPGPSRPAPRSRACRQQSGAFGVDSRLRLERRLERAHVVVRKRADAAPRQSRADGAGEVDAVVDEEEIALPDEGGHHRRNGGDAERVDDGLLRAQEGG